MEKEFFDKEYIEELNLYNSNGKFNDNKFIESIEKIRAMNDRYYRETSRRKKSYTETYGCQMNEHDTENINWMLSLMGYEATDSLEDADFFLFNTCAIRENAELKVYGKIGSLKTLKESYPDLKIAICGCMMQIESIRNTIEEKFRHVDIIFGTHNIYKLPELYVKNLETGRTVVDVVGDSSDIIEGMDNLRLSKHSAYVNIMFGCNNFCTYCVVPYTRGREISRRPEDILKEVEDLSRAGYKEIMLLGQNVNSYGKSLEEDYSFTDLLRSINKIEGLERIRFMTSHPRDISDELIEAYGELDKLSNHLHLPVQSGSNEILKKMNRHYTREKYLESIRKIRSIRPDISISTDIIIGFPGETEEDFRETLSLIEEVRYDFVYNFIYSKRPATKAAEMEDQIPYDVKHRRFEELNEAINRIVLEKNKKLIGSKVKVLVDDVSKSDDEMLSGRTEEFKLVHFKASKELIGEIVEVYIKDARTFSLEGELL